MTVRRFQPGDAASLYDICLRTGASGQDASSRYADPELLGHVYVGPYLKLAPEFAFVVEDRDVTGYVVGAPDTHAFESSCEQHWWPPLRDRYPPPAPADRSPDADMVRLVHEPPHAAEPVLDAYPAHLHIDLLPRSQGQGYGRRLLDVLFAAFARAAVPGVHLGVGAGNHRAIAFYRRMGFEELDRSPGSIVMARPLT